MTESVIIDAVDDDKKDGHLGALVDLWATGYALTAADAAFLKKISLNPAYKTNPDTEAAIEDKARAFNYYRSLPKERGNAEQRLKKAAATYDIHLEVLRYIVNGRDGRVSERASELVADEFPNDANSGPDAR